MVDNERRAYRGEVWTGPVGTPEPTGPASPPAEWTNVGHLAPDGTATRAEPTGDTFTVERTMHSTTITRTTADGAVTRVHSPNDQVAEDLWQHILGLIDRMDPAVAERIQREYQRWLAQVVDLPDMPFARYWLNATVGTPFTGRAKGSGKTTEAAAALALDQAICGGTVDTFRQRRTEEEDRIRAWAYVDWPEPYTTTHRDTLHIAGREPQTVEGEVPTGGGGC